MPEEQSVRARDGAADPHGCGNPLRSGIPFLTFHLPLTATPFRAISAQASKSKASAPGMARPIRMDAGILCDQAYLS
jgi:hypothetical protein